ncbi:glucokinase [Sphingosinicella sp. YJ22]|uniref:glucokinase n=1 Tax=Sphingosinicella sp. YJ22 TaxID=1104780 RepID=UPI001408861B|nr:glucokinase [Sphingosinicella sp. YJ22]
MKIVAGDIGGTHARFAIAEVAPGAPVRLGPMRKYRTREHADFGSAWAAFRSDNGGALPAAASLAVAIAIEGDVLRFPNNDWALDRRTLAGELGLDQLLLLNDFGAVAHAVSALGADALEPLGGPEAPAAGNGITSVIGPGTGLGVALFAEREGRVEVIETEAAHMAFAPQSLEEEAVERVVRARYGRCSIERVVSGPGLVEIYAMLGGGEWDVLDAGTLWSAAIDGDDPVAARALDLLVACFGAAAGDICLAHGSMRVVVTGGLTNRMKARLATPLFHDPFRAKGRYRPRMERVPVQLCTYPEPGLLGAAVAFQRGGGA